MIVRWLNSQKGTDRVQKALAASSPSPPKSPPSSNGEKVEKFGDLLPDRLKQIYQSLKNNPDLMNLRPDVAFLELLQREIIMRLSSGESQDLWIRLNQAANDAKVAFRQGDQDGYSAAINEIFKLINIGVNGAFARNEYVQISRQKAQIVKIQFDMDRSSQELLPASTFEALIAEWQEAVRSVCGDEKLQEATRLYRQTRLEKTWRGE